MFKNRKEAGDKLAIALDKYRKEKPIVLAIPRGGVEIGYRVAMYLEAEMSLIVVRKLPFPDNPEAGFGAIAENGSTFIFPEAGKWLSNEEMQSIEEAQIAEIERRIDVLRSGKPLPDIENRTVILVDDGIAMGSTMRAAIMLCKKKKAKKIVVAVPVTGRETAAKIGDLIDDMVVLEMPHQFYAVAQVYENWYDVPDFEVLEIMKMIE
ncbi:MAG: phosphoribosyltransferase [Methanosarcinales archaeon]|nr:phosphoribosyltransferase [Methanosarcinales archaeon]